MIKSADWIFDQCQTPHYVYQPFPGCIEYLPKELTAHKQQILELSKMLASANVSTIGGVYTPCITPITEKQLAEFKPLITGFDSLRLSDNHYYKPKMVCENDSWISEESFWMTKYVIMRVSIKSKKGITSLTIGTTDLFRLKFESIDRSLTGDQCDVEIFFESVEVW